MARDPILTSPREASSEWLSVVVKCAPEDDAWRGRVNEIGLLKTEAYFYRDIGEKCGIPIPHCWHAAWREDDGHCTIVMDDLHPLVPGDNFAGLGTTKPSSASNS